MWHHVMTCCRGVSCAYFGAPTSPCVGAGDSCSRRHAGASPRQASGHERERGRGQSDPGGGAGARSRPAPFAGGEPCPGCAGVPASWVRVRAPHSRPISELHRSPLSDHMSFGSSALYILTYRLRLSSAHRASTILCSQSGHSTMI